MKALPLLLTGLFIYLQYELWISPSSFAQVWRSKQDIVQLNAENQQMIKTNSILAANVQELKQGDAAVEAAARARLGMIKDGETYYRIIR